MFPFILTLHILGAGLSIGVVVYGLQAVIRKKGNIQKLETASISLAIYEIATGLMLVALKPSVSALTTFCIIGMGFIVIFVAINALAKYRIEQPQTP